MLGPYQYNLLHRNAEYDCMPNPERIALREVLQTSVCDHVSEAFPYALQHRVIYQDHEPAMSDEARCLYWKAGQTSHLALSEVPADQRLSLSGVSERIKTCETLFHTLYGHANLRGLSCDKFSEVPVALEIYHMPRGSIVAWTMNDARRELYTSLMQEGRQFDAPKAAHGILWTSSAGSNHGRLQIEAHIGDTLTRYRRILRQTAPEVILSGLEEMMW